MKRKLLRVSLIVLAMLPCIAFAHFMAFPQETRCMLIRFSDYQKTGNIYFRETTNAETRAELQNLQKIARERVARFWPENIDFDYDIIFCNNKNEYNKYGVPGAPAATHLKAGAYVVLQAESLNTNIIAHEIVHTVLYNNLGWYKAKFKIPAWFDEGLAMQVDDRSYYSEDVYIKKSVDTKMPDVGYFREQPFFADDSDTTVLHFLAVKHVIREWLRTHSLRAFVNRMNHGESFENAFAAQDQ